MIGTGDSVIALPLRTILCPERGLIFRITHRDNVAWMMRHGIFCRSSEEVDPNYVNIGNTDLIAKRATRSVAIPPGGTLSDYVPFYFTPKSIMLFNIKTGFNGIKKRQNSEIVILVSSLYKIAEIGSQFIFTDRHAYLKTAKFYSRIDNLSHIDWNILQNVDFKSDGDDMGKKERYQAEALIHAHMDFSALLCIAVHSSSELDQVNQALKSADREMPVIVRPRWYF